MLSLFLSRRVGSAALALAISVPLTAAVIAPASAQRGEPRGHEDNRGHRDERRAPEHRDYYRGYERGGYDRGGYNRGYDHGDHDNGGAVLGGAILGLGLGAVLGGVLAPPPQPYYYAAPPPPVYYAPPPPVYYGYGN
jgi:hypothetical protein